mmetsp:Transcript_37441/g.93079  ORF Transcript_37441/g.93079 Transcript_37441/m.93079 type:complete len:204 (-) Transcript_37441:378-989(-)
MARLHSMTRSRKSASSKSSFPSSEKTAIALCRNPGMCRTCSPSMALCNSLMTISWSPSASSTPNILLIAVTSSSVKAKYFLVRLVRFRRSVSTLIRSVASCMPVTMMPTNTLTKTSAEKRIKEKKYSMARKPCPCDLVHRGSSGSELVMSAYVAPPSSLLYPSTPQPLIAIATTGFQSSIMDIRNKVTNARARFLKWKGSFSR